MRRGLYVKLATLALMILVATPFFADAQASRQGLYAAFESGDVLRGGCELTASIVVPDEVVNDPPLIGVIDRGDPEEPDKFVVAFHRDDALPLTGVGIWLGRRSETESIRSSVWEAGAEPGSRHSVRIVYRNGVVTFYVDGSPRYSFRPRSQDLGVIYYGGVGYSITCPSTTATMGQQLSGVLGVGAVSWVLAVAFLGAAILAMLFLAGARRR